MAERYKILVMTHDEDAQKEWKGVHSSDLNALLDASVVKNTCYDHYQEGKRFDKFDFVIVCTPS